MLKQVAILGLVAGLGGCVTAPEPPSLSVLPGTNKTDAAFRSDDAACRAGSVATPATTTAAARPAGDYYACMQSHGNLLVANRDVPVPVYGGYPYAYPYASYPYAAYGYPYGGYGYGYPYAAPVLGLGIGIGFGGYYGGYYRGGYYGHGYYGRGYGGYGGYRGVGGGYRGGTAGGLPIIRR